MEKQQSVVNQLAQMIPDMKKERNDPTVCAASAKLDRIVCQFCDKAGHTTKQCVGLHKKKDGHLSCYNCGKEGHKKSQCRSKTKN